MPTTALDKKASMKMTEEYVRDNEVACPFCATESLDRSSQGEFPVFICFVCKIRFEIRIVEDLG